MTEQQQPEPSGSAAQRKAALGCLWLIGLSFAGTALMAFPAAGFFLAGLGAATGVRRARAWVTERREKAPEEELEADPVDIVAHLQALGDGGQHVLLTALREAADLPDTKTVRGLLDEAGIRVRAGVRTPAGNGPGVHGSDIPAPSPTPSDPSPAGCLCSSEAANANTNNNRPDIVQDPDNPHHWLVKERV